MKLLKTLFGTLFGGLLLAGCRSTEYSVRPCKDFAIDGKLSAAEWNKSGLYPLQPLLYDDRLGGVLHEKGTVRMLMSEKFLYVGLDLEDSDIVAQGTEDQTHLYQMGDTIELFFKPGNDTYYWEMYGTPNELKTTFFYPSRSYVFVPQSAAPKPDFEVRTHLNGTMNNWQSPDKGWTIEFKIPLKTFEQFGAKFRPGEDWRFLIARQNFSRRLPLKELSTIPSVRKADFHIIEQYGKLNLEAAEK